MFTEKNSPIIFNLDVNSLGTIVYWIKDREQIEMTNKLTMSKNMVIEEENKVKKRGRKSKKEEYEYYSQMDLSPQPVQSPSPKITQIDIAYSFDPKGVNDVLSEINSEESEEFDM